MPELALFSPLALAVVAVIEADGDVPRFGTFEEVKDASRREETSDGNLVVFGRSRRSCSGGSGCGCNSGGGTRVDGVLFLLTRRWFVEGEVDDGVLFEFFGSDGGGVDEALVGRIDVGDVVPEVISVSETKKFGSVGIDGSG